MTNHCLSGICGVFLIPILGCTDLVGPPKMGMDHPFAAESALITIRS